MGMVDVPHVIRQGLLHVISVEVRESIVDGALVPVQWNARHVMAIPSAKDVMIISDPDTGIVKTVREQE